MRKILGVDQPLFLMGVKKERNAQLPKDANAERMY